MYRSLSLVVVCLLVAIVTTSVTHPLFARIVYPHVVLGGGARPNDVSYKTIVQASNRLHGTYIAILYLYSTGGADTWPGDWRIEYTNSDGKHQEIDMTGKDGLIFTIDPLGTRVFTLVGDNQLRTGHIGIIMHRQSVSRADAEDALATSVMYQAYRRGELIDAVGVPGGDTTTALGRAFAVKSRNKHFTIPVSKGVGYNTGVAIVYDDQYTSSSLSTTEPILKFTLHGPQHYTAEREISNDILKPPAGSDISSFTVYHMAYFFDEMFPDVADRENFNGALIIEAVSGHCYVMALRVDNMHNGNTQLTSIPILGDASW